MQTILVILASFFNEIRPKRRFAAETPAIAGRWVLTTICRLAAQNSDRLQPLQSSGIIASKCLAG
jgi:hypothetical protein